MDGDEETGRVKRALFHLTPMPTFEGSYLVLCLGDREEAEVSSSCQAIWLSGLVRPLAVDNWVPKAKAVHTVGGIDFHNTLFV